MRRSTKGAIAAAGAAVLLVGGGSTLAYWNATASLPGGTITSGHMSLDATDTGTWKLNGTTVSNISSVKVVPGDTLVFTGAYTVDVSGNNLKGTLSVAGGAASGTLAAKVTTTSSFQLNGTAISGTPTLTASDNGDTVNATITIAFPFGSSVDNTSQDSTLNLANVSVALTQVSS